MSNEDVVQARQFQVLDRQGRVRAVLGMSDTKKEAEIKASPEKPTLQLNRLGGSVALKIDLSPQLDYNEFDNEVTIENIIIALSDGEDILRLKIWMSTSISECPAIDFRDPEGRHRLGVGITPYDMTELDLSDEEGRPHWIKRSI